MQDPKLEWLAQRYSTLANILIKRVYWTPFAQAYTSQILSLVMFGLMMCEDRISMQERRREIIQGLKQLPGSLRQSI